jgi:ferric-dicitrate binding protein FerR (iron transport regulator)
MKQQLLLGVWTMFAACSLAMGQAQPLQTTSLPVGSATLVEAQGKVILRSPRGEALSVKPGVTLLPESTIETAKGSAVLNLEDGSQVLVKPNSRVVLKSPQDSTGLYLQQWLGRIIVKAQKRIGNTPSFRMGTPTAVISVRGTRFEVEVKNKNRTNVSVYEGLVEVRGVSGSGSPVLVGPGFSTSVQESRQPEPPSKVELPAGGARHSGGDSYGRRQDDHMQSPGSISSGQFSHGSDSGEDDGPE